MWKLLRNVLLLTAAMAAALWLLLWVAAQQQAASIAAQLAPWAELRYARAGAGLDGVLSLGGPSGASNRGRGATPSAPRPWGARRSGCG